MQLWLGSWLAGLKAGAYAVDADGAIVAVNHEAETLLARSADDLLGRDAHDLLHRDGNGMPVPRSQCSMMEAFMSRRTRQEDLGHFERGDGTLLTMSWLATPLRISADEMGALVVFHEHEGAEPSQQEPALSMELLSELERLALLAETTTQLTSTLDVDEALDRLVGLVVPLLADWAVVDLISDNDEVWRTVVAHEEGGRLVRRKDLEGAMPPIPQVSPQPLSRALRGAGSTLATPATYQGAPDSGIAVEQARLFDVTHMHTALIAPIRGLREVLGALTLGRSDRPEPFTSADIPLLEDIARRAGLALDNARLFQRQRKVAETMQRHLLPQMPPVPGLEMAARYLPAPHASQVGGDWYDAFYLADRSLALVIGDVVGHDLDAAAEMAQLRNILRAYAWTHQEPPSIVVGHVDEAIPHISEVELATMIFGRLETDATGQWTLRWTNAGHPPPLLVTYDGQSRYLTDGHGLLLGTHVSIPREDATVVLPPQSTLVLYTDGLIESPGRSLDDGLERLRRNAASLARRPLEGFTDLVMERARPDDNDDDVALLVVRVPPKDGPPT
ncbi:SpoIIE family protein phosphatase [Streptomyces peucetius]|uniref:SpoIIE family protein phosphatase n=1 Tax=Streptomyces peucetius TaxID=1950 RepID=A0ABY6IHB2_STRPE|nr:SpoIIE family protein phosphatase [Streptomyces peucetius]UYQ66393.1 SpoIIE family protein phosphatase [Streptomyces peucetius]